MKFNTCKNFFSWIILQKKLARPILKSFFPVSIFWGGRGCQMVVRGFLLIFLLKSISPVNFIKFCLFNRHFYMKATSNCFVWWSCASAVKDITSISYNLPRVREDDYRIRIFLPLGFNQGKSGWLNGQWMTNESTFGKEWCKLKHRCLAWLKFNLAKHWYNTFV